MTTQIEERLGHVIKPERAENFHFAPSCRSGRKRYLNRNSLPRNRGCGRICLHPADSASLDYSAVPSWKRWLDASCVLASLPLSVPLLLAVAFWIRMVSRGPALFRQERIGLNGKSFVLYKFRSMHHGAGTLKHEMHVAQLVKSDSPMIKLDLLGDSRLIRGGRFLRASGLDELPQIFNVLWGEMSLVGPRPCLREEFQYFTTSQRKRFEVLPGLTGLWQINGKNCTTFKEMNLMDVDYSRKASPVLDLLIMLRTPMALLRQMYQSAGGTRLKESIPGGFKQELDFVVQRLADRV